MAGIFGSSIQELKDFFTQKGEKEFFAKQIFQWIYQKKVLSFEAMTTLSKKIREDLSSHFEFFTLKLAMQKPSQEGETIKFLWELSDGHFIESVLIFSKERRTVCVSCQVGCPVRCAFCASGKKGFFRNLTTSEIVEQVAWIDRLLHEKNERVSHIVFMGMGEPLENFEEVVKAIHIFGQEEGLKISQRRMSLSTVGILEKIDALAKEDLNINLVLSLHAPTQELREKFIPYAKKNPLEKLLQAMDRYFQTTKRDITYEYVLIAGWNDSREDAKKLASLLRGRQCSVNLIPFNPVENLSFDRPQKEAIEAFRSILVDQGIPTTWRFTKGKDITAACGQLALQQKPI